MNRRLRNILMLAFIIGAIFLIYRMGLRAFELGHGTMILGDIQAGRITSSQISQMSQAERDALLAHQFPWALAYAIASVSGIVLFIATVTYAGLRGFHLLETNVVWSTVIMVGTSLMTGVAFAAAPAALGKPLFETSGIAFVAAILVFVLAILVFLSAFSLRKLFRRAFPA